MTQTGKISSFSIRLIIDQIFILGGSTITSISTQLTALREATMKSMLALTKAYDSLCTSIAVHKSEIRPIIDALINNERPDKYWSFFLGDVQENQLARPDDYNYFRNFTQSPFWISLLCTKFNILPPALVI